MNRRLHIVKTPERGPDEFARIEDAIAAMRKGEMVIVVDDENRENEGDLTIAAEKITPEVINFMAMYGRGLVCIAMTPERLDELDIPLVVSSNGRDSIQLSVSASRQRTVPQLEFRQQIVPLQF